MLDWHSIDTDLPPLGMPVLVATYVGLYDIAHRTMIDEEWQWAVDCDCATLESVTLSKNTVDWWAEINEPEVGK